MQTTLRLQGSDIMENFDTPIENEKTQEPTTEETVPQVGEGQAEETSPEVTTEEGTEPSEGQTDETEYMTVKYLGEEMKIPKEEWQTYIQKGLNHDRLKEERDALKNDKRFQFVEKLYETVGKKNGIESVDAYIERAMAELEKQRINEYAEQNNVPPEIAEKLMELEQFKESITAEQERKRAEEQAKEQLNKEVEGFQKAYPDVKIQDIPQEVLDIREQHQIPLEFAYAKYKLENLQSQVEQNTIEELMAKNKSSVGKVGNGTPPPKSPFGMSKQEFEQIKERVLRGEKVQL